MSGARAPTIAGLDAFSEAPADGTFRPFASLDLTGGNATATITFASELITFTSDMAFQRDTPLPGFTSMRFAASGIEALEDLLQAVQFTWADAATEGAAALFTLSLSGRGGGAIATTEVRNAAADAPTEILDLPERRIFWDHSPILNLFGLVRLEDADPGAVLRVSISWDAAFGTLGGLPAGTAVLRGPDGAARVELAGTPGDLTSVLGGLGFIPVADLYAPEAGDWSGHDVTFTIRAEDGRGTDAAVARMALNLQPFPNVPEVSGLLPVAPAGGASATILVDERLLPFATVRVVDPDAEPGVRNPETLMAVVEVLDAVTGALVPGRGLLLSGAGGAYNAATGVWEVSGDRPTVEAALRALAFAPDRLNTGDTRLALSILDQFEVVRHDGTVVRTLPVTGNIALAPGELGVGAVLEGRLSADLAPQLLAIASHAYPDLQSSLFVSAIEVLGGGATARVDTVTGSAAIEADGFDATAPTIAFRYTISDPYGSSAVGTGRIEVSGPVLPTTRGTLSAETLRATASGQRLLGLEGNDTILAATGFGGNRIFGGPGDDSIHAPGSANRIEGGLGDDRIVAGARAEVDVGDGANRVTLLGGMATVTGWDGDTLVQGGTGGSVVRLGDGRNRVLLDGSGNRVTLGDGGNEVQPGLHDARVTTGAGEDLVRLAGARAMVWTGGGGDTITGLATATTGHWLDGGAGNDLVRLNAGASTVLGGDGDDRIELRGDGNLVRAGNGADTVRVLGGVGATVLGGAGDDMLVMAGGNGALLSGEAGADVLIGGTGRDSLNGGLDNDSLSGGLGGDSLLGGAGGDTLDGGGGADTMLGGADDDAYLVDNRLDLVSEAGGSGQDRVIATVSFTLPANVEALELRGDWTAALTGTGNALANLILGSSGGDRLFGMDGADTIAGGDGNDTIRGGPGADLLSGGGGAYPDDVFVYGSPAEGGDTILGWQPGEDRVQILASGFGLTPGQDLLATFRLRFGPESDAPTGFGQFFYREDLFELWWDADGVGTADPVLILALQQTFVGLLASDIFVA